MAEATSKIPVKTEKPEHALPSQGGWPSLADLRQEIDRVFDDFGRWRFPSRLFRDFEAFRGWKGTAPAVDISESSTAYELTAELPGMEEKNIDLEVANRGLTIKAEKKEEREEKEKDYYLSERRHGSSERYFRVPETVDIDKIAATFKNGVLTVTLPKKPEAQKPAKKVEVKAA